MSDINSRLKKLRKRMKDEKADGMLISNVSSVRYMSGFTGDSAMLLITSNKKLLITDARFTQQAKETAKGFQIHEYKKSFFGYIGEKVKELKIKKLIVESHILTYSVFEAIKKECGRKVKLVPKTDVCETIMRIKDEDNIKIICKAISVAEKAFKYICKNVIKPGVTEREIGLELQYQMIKNGAQRESFGAIIAVDKNAALPHYPTGNVKVKKNSAILIDWGAMYDFYASDCTRMVYMSEPSKKWKEVHEVVRVAQQEAYKVIKPGIKASDVDAAARNYITEMGYGEKFAHGLGHGIGMNVHEGPGISSKCDIVLEPGMVFTVEPGVYLPGWGGVRIEDIVVVTKTGYKRLTKLPVEKYK